MSEQIIIEREGAIATVILNNPERRNALNRGSWAILAECMTDLSADLSADGCADRGDP